MAGEERQELLPDLPEIAFLSDYLSICLLYSSTHICQYDTRGNNAKETNNQSL